MNEQKIKELVENLFAEIEENADFAKREYFYDESCHYYNSFRKIILGKLKNQWKDLTRNELDEIAVRFNEIAKRKKSEVFFPTSIYECIDYLDKSEEDIFKQRFLSKESIDDLCRYISLSFKFIDFDTSNTQSNIERKNILSLSFNSESEYTSDYTIDEDYNDGKGEALLRGINSKYRLDKYDKSLVRENEIKQFLIQKELNNVSWINNISSLKIFNKTKFDRIILINPPICNYTVDDNIYVADIQNYGRIKETLKGYGKLLKNPGILFIIIEYLAVNTDFLQELQKVVKQNSLCIKTVVNFYTMEKEAPHYHEEDDDDYSEFEASKQNNLTLIIIEKGHRNTDYIKFVSVDNLMDDNTIEQIIKMKDTDVYTNNDHVVYVPQKIKLFDSPDFMVKTEKIHYSMLEKYFKIYYENSVLINNLKKSYNENHNGKDRGSISVSIKDSLYLGDLANTSEALGLYYAGFQNLDSLNISKKYLEIASWCHKDVANILTRVKKKIDMRQRGNLQFNEYKKVFGLLYPFGTTENIQRVLLQNVEKRMQDEFGLEYWNSLQKETKAYLNTALFTLMQYISVGEELNRNLDYSGVISLLMRALEYELEIYFCREYLGYLQNEYPNAQIFLKEINMKCEERKYIVHEVYSGKTVYWSYCDTDSNVAEQKFQFFMLKKIMGYSDRYIKGNLVVTIDKTFMKYLKYKMNGYYNCDEQKILNWLGNLVENVEYLRPKRNRASHGGSVLNINDAMDAFYVLVLVEKIIKELIMPFKLKV